MLKEVLLKGVGERERLNKSVAINVQSEGGLESAEGVHHRYGVYDCLGAVLTDPREVQCCNAVGGNVSLLVSGAVEYVAVFVGMGVDVDDGDVADTAGLCEEGPE